MLAQALGFELDSIDEQIEPVMASARVETEFLVVEPGQVAGVRQICVGARAGTPLATLELQMYVGATEPADTVFITGVPALTVTVPGGTHGDLATAATVVNAIPLVVRSQPGLKTALDLPVRYVRDLAVDSLVRA
jgi:4-hydroxy-tetrahydrodipicolinate reductase